ncbi:unnamed protein product, partial [Phaeothamnion confervicola]
KCPGCLAVAGCGYCLSTLQCLEGTISGPGGGAPCPNWLADDEACPGVPHCDEYEGCDACAGDDACAWCASAGVCLTVSDIFGSECRGLVFDPPCPTSFIGGTLFLSLLSIITFNRQQRLRLQKFVVENRVVGDLVVEADPLFGGGRVTASGTTATGQPFSLALNETHFEVQAGYDVALRAGASAAVNDRGGSVDIAAGNGANPMGGAGGDVRRAGGAGTGQAFYGG